MELSEMEKWVLYQTEGSEWYAIRKVRIPAGRRED